MTVEMTVKMTKFVRPTSGQVYYVRNETNFSSEYWEENELIILTLIDDAEGRALLEEKLLADAAFDAK